MKLTTGIIRAIFLFPIVKLYVQTVTCLRLVEIVDDLLVLCHDKNDKKFALCVPIGTSITIKESERHNERNK